MAQGLLKFQSDKPFAPHPFAWMYAADTAFYLTKNLTIAEARSGRKTVERLL
jgi:hypothetical protein